MLVPIGLHEDHAQFGGGFEDEFAVARGAGGMVEGDELVGDGAAARGEVGDAGAEGLGRAGAALAAGLVEDLADGFEEFGGIFGDEADGFAVDEEAVFADDGFDGEVLAGREADELGDFEVDGAEAVEERDETVGVAAADGEVGSAEGFPGWGVREVEFFVVNAGGGVGRGRRSSVRRRRRRRGAGRGGGRGRGLGGGGFRSLRDSRSRDRTNVSGAGRYVLLILNQLGGETGRKTGHVCPVCGLGPERGSPP